MKENPKADLDITLKLWAERREALRRFQCRPDSEKSITNLTPVTLSAEERGNASERIANVEKEAWKVVKRLEKQERYRQSIQNLASSLKEGDKYGEGAVARIMKEKREEELASYREKVTSQRDDLSSGWIML